jgi:putative N6-adenine-specific DNA methylase
MSTERLFIICGLGLEYALERELQRLSLAGDLETGGIELDAAVLQYQQLNRQLRCASRVLLRVGMVESPAALKHFTLQPFRKPGQPVTFHVSGQRVMAWEKAAQQCWGGTNPNGALGVYLRGLEQGAEVSLDTSGELLHHRGFRQEMGRAPLRENLAAGILELGGFEKHLPVWDIMCGSGAIAIEAAEMMQGLLPGRQRHFAFEQFANYRPLERSAEPAPMPVRPQAAVFGSDINAGALGVTRRNAKRAGVFEALTLERLDATSLPERSGPTGLVIANFPYGKRVGDKAEIPALARKVEASVLRACKGWRFAFLFAEPTPSLSLPVEASFPLQNGGIRCQLVCGTV